VPYRDLISPFRAVAQTQNKVERTTGEKVRRWLAAETIPYPGRFRWALVGAKVGRALGPIVPGMLRPMLSLAPGDVPAEVKLKASYPAQGERRARVALLAGCAQQVLDPDINVATIEVLTRNGIEVVVPESQGCCGGLSWHTGDLGAAQAFARKNLAAFPADVDAILTNAAGCGSAMHEYHLILKGTPDEARVQEFGLKQMWKSPNGTSATSSTGRSSASRSSARTCRASFPAGPSRSSSAAMPSAISTARPISRCPGLAS
jgi:glycolate oxidase iron-sulfur subunit